MSNIKYQCPRCLHLFPKKYNLDKHLKRKNPCQLINDSVLNTNDHNLPASEPIRPRLSMKVVRNVEMFTDKSPISNRIVGMGSSPEINNNESDESSICIYCGSKLKHKKNLRRHYETCPHNPNQVANINYNLLHEINKLKTEFQQQLNELKQQPRVVEQHNQNILQVVCIGSNDNYLDMLTEQWGFDKALGFIKDCALSQLSGDCKLLEKIYFDNRSGEVPIRYLDRNRNKIEFIDEKHQKVIDLKGIQLSRRLANNLQNSYLKGVNYLIKKNLDGNSCPNKFLEEYDLQSWNQHIYELSDSRYQRKILSQLEIPDH